MPSPKNKSLNKAKITFVYDRINKFGGAERVLLALNKLFPEAPIYTLVYDKQQTSWANHIKVIPTFLNKISFIRRHHQFLSPISALAFETFDFSKYDLVISITSESAKAIITKPEILHICYCLTPNRFLWSGKEDYINRPGMGILSPLVKIILKKNINSLRKKDFYLSYRPDHYLTISNEVKKRIKKYYRQSSNVIYPPINYQYFSKAPKMPKKHFLAVGRLVPYKRFDSLVKAFSIPPLNQHKLIIVGTGSELPKLKRLASKNIIFKGQVSDSDLRLLYASAHALIFPQKEDFGIVSLEAQATGTPVLALSQGGALETVIEEKTGLFFPKPFAKDIINSVDHLLSGKHQITPEECRQNAKRFSTKKFHQSLFVILNTLWQQHQKTFM
jgi:glycosyltransferase involved in cell wall biosynthesis